MNRLKLVKRKETRAFNKNFSLVYSPKYSIAELRSQSPIMPIVASPQVQTNLFQYFF